MKTYLTLVLFLVLALPVAAQSGNTNDWDKLVTSLDNEDWESANNLSLTLLKQADQKSPTDTAAAVLRYMYIYSEAGLMSIGKDTKEQGIKKVKNFAGKFIILPSHPVTAGRGFNSIQGSDQGSDPLFITASNKAATSILCFEYITPAEKWTMDDLKNRSGQNWQLGGTLKTITVEGQIFPRFKLLVDKAFARQFNGN